MAPNFLNDFKKGQSEIASAIRLLVLQENENLFSKLDFVNDDIFLEPFLFLYFNQKDKTKLTLWQILLGYIKKSKLPNDFPIDVTSNNNGQVYIPKIGYFDVGKADKKLTLQVERKKTYNFYCGSEKIAYKFIPATVLNSSSIEVYPSNDRLFKSLYSGFLNEVHKKQMSLSLKSLYGISLGKLNHAYKFIKASGLNYSTPLSTATRGVFSFEDKNLWSFADKAAHGISFICGKPTDSVIFFICELAHQGGHTVFNAVIQNNEKIFLADPYTPMKMLTDNEKDERSLFGAFHGLFTTAKVAEVLDYAYSSNTFKGELKRELLGRLVDNHYRHRTGLEKMNHKKVFTPKGFEIYSALDKYLYRVYTKYQNLIKQCDLTNQDFVFDLEKFKKLNPFI